MLKIIRLSEFRRQAKDLKAQTWSLYDWNPPTFVFMTEKGMVDWLHNHYEVGQFWFVDKNGGVVPPKKIPSTKEYPNVEPRWLVFRFKNKEDYAKESNSIKDISNRILGRVKQDIYGIDGYFD